MTYKGFLLASAGGLAAASGSAQAADLPVKAAMAAPVAAQLDRLVCRSACRWRVAKYEFD